MAAITYRVGSLEILCYAQAYLDGRWQPRIAVTMHDGNHSEEEALDLQEAHDDPSQAQQSAFDAAIRRYGTARPTPSLFADSVSRPRR